MLSLGDRQAQGSSFVLQRKRNPIFKGRACVSLKNCLLSRRGLVFPQPADCEGLRRPHPGGSPHQHVDMGRVPARRESWCGLAHVAHQAMGTKPLTQAENTVECSGLGICVKGDDAAGRRRRWPAMRSCLFRSDQSGRLPGGWGQGRRTSGAVCSRRMRWRSIRRRLRVGG